MRKDIKRETVLDTVEKKYATEPPEGKETGSVLAEDAVVSVKQIIIADLSQNSKN